MDISQQHSSEKNRALRPCVRVIPCEKTPRDYGNTTSFFIY